MKWSFNCISTILFQPIHSAYKVQWRSYRIIGALHQSVGIENIHLNTEITSIIDEGGSLKLIDSLQNEFLCKCLIIAMPPRLINNSIQFQTELPIGVNKVMRKTQTWRSGSTKFSVEYERPF